jgi:hypothetical protein
VKKPSSGIGSLPSFLYSSTQPVKLNGLKIEPKGDTTVKITLSGPESSPLSALVKASNAKVTMPFGGSTMVLENGSFTWAIGPEGKYLEGLDPPAKFNGLKVSGSPTAPALTSDKTSVKIPLYLKLPAGMGGATSSQPVYLKPGAAASGDAFSFSVPSGALGPIGLNELTVSYDGDGLWEISAGVALPPPIPYEIDGAVGIQDGAFAYGEAQIDNLNIGFGPVFLQRIKFRIEVNPKKSECVPKYGIQKINVDDLLHDIGVHQHPPPIIEIDHGIPNFALCGEVELTAGPTIPFVDVAAIRLDAGLGFATYPDRPAVLRAYGQVYLVEIPLADALFQLHTNGYVKMRAEFNVGLADVAHIEGFLNFEMLAPKFNAEAWIEACVDLISLCAGARGLISSKGVAICLRLPPFDWQPGFGYVWGGDFDIYWSGCSVGPYKEQINASAAGTAMAAGTGQVLEVKSGLPGFAVTVTGEGAPPKVTLLGPNGEQYTTPDSDEAITEGEYWLIKDPRFNTTSIAVPDPAPGRWELVVDDDSVPVTSIQQADGLDEPEVSAKVRGSGHSRQLQYRVTPLEGQVVTFVEDGASAGDIIGVAKGAQGQIRFRPADGTAEQRDIYAVVEQDGFVRDRIKVASYKAPGAFRPPKPQQLRVKRTASALRLSWRRSSGAREYEVRVHLSDGRHLHILTKKTRLSVPKVARALGGSVSVRGISSSGMRGNAVRAKTSPSRRGR